jgi:RimJ/RimL family protein N-acetyltransferase
MAIAASAQSCKFAGDMSLTLLAINRDGAINAPAIRLPPMAVDVCQATAAMYENTGFTQPWIGYVATDGGVAVGSCAFKTAPSAGAVEIAWFTFPGHEGREVAAGMVRALLAIAAAADPALKVVAHTAPEEGAATGVLETCGFQLLGNWDDPVIGPVWEWEHAT